MYRTILVLSLASLAASEFDEQLHAKYKSLPHDEFIEYFNSQNFTYNITHYDHLEGNNFNCALLDRDSKFPVLKHSPDAFKDLPENFDAREKWPHCDSIRDIYDQGKCGSCWAFGVATSLSDRTCISLNKVVRLSEQDFECCKDCHDSDGVCDGGWPKKAFQFWLEGLVTQECKPYNINELNKNICNTTCVDTSIDYKKDKHAGRKVYAVDTGEDNVRTELFKNGPIETGFDVFEDFYNYKSGIYIHKFGGWLGAHSVRVIGYGVENGVKYWLGANSWGTKWGENGNFRILRYQQCPDFESDMFAGTL